MFEIANADGKMRTFNWDFNLTQATVWGFLMLNILGVLVYPQDQVMMQRVLSTKSDKAAGRSVWTLAAIVVPGIHATGALVPLRRQQGFRMITVTGDVLAMRQGIEAELAAAAGAVDADADGDIY